MRPAHGQQQSLWTVDLTPWGPRPADWLQKHITGMRMPRFRTKRCPSTKLSARRRASDGMLRRRRNRQNGQPKMDGRTLRRLLQSVRNGVHPNLPDCLGYHRRIQNMKPSKPICRPSRNRTKKTRSGSAKLQENLAYRAAVKHRLTSKDRSELLVLAYLALNAPLALREPLSQMTQPAD